MYSVVLMAALTTGMDLPDRGGCRGGGHGCRGGGRSSRRHGCCGCGGGGYGMGHGGCMGMGMGYGGGYGGCMGMGGYGGMMMPHHHPLPEKAPQPKEKKPQSMGPASATIMVELPADAKLLIDKEATTSTGESRVFQSPVLNPGKEYQYTLTAEMVRDGKPIKAEKVVRVKAGEITPVTLTLPLPGIAQR